MTNDQQMDDRPAHAFQSRSTSAPAETDPTTTEGTWPTVTFEQLLAEMADAVCAWRQVLADGDPAQADASAARTCEEP